MELKPVKMRGLDSNGMLCSAGELGIDAKLLLPEQRDGIFYSPADTPLLGPISKPSLVLMMSSLILTLRQTAVTASTCWGLPANVPPSLGTKPTLPDYAPESGEGTPASDRATVDIVATDVCSRFGLRMIENLEIKESPEWMQKLLRAVNIRPINNVVDVTNYVMMELGQPMHAYDYDKVAGHHWVVRRAHEGEHLKTLDGQDRAPFAGNDRHW